MLNEGTFGATQVGKFMTIYPDSPNASLELARRLVDATDGFCGPRIVTDLFLGAVVYVRYGPHNPQLYRDRLGLFDGGDKQRQADYTVPFVAPEGIENPFLQYEDTTPPRTKGPALVGPGYLITQTVQVHAKGSVFEAIDLRQQKTVGRVVLKEGRRYCVSDMYGRDIWDRLRNQAQAHEALAGKASIPAAQPLFQQGDNLYLPLAYVPGRDFGARDTTPYAALTLEDQKQLVHELWLITAALDKLHREGYVHRDLTVRNVRITPDDSAFLLDLEICHRIDDATKIPFSQGTPGFVSPQQLAGDAPTFGDDVYAFGALMIIGLTGCDPQRVLFSHGVDRVFQLRVLSGAPEYLCRLAAACVSEDPSGRPSVNAIKDVLANSPLEVSEAGEVGFPALTHEHSRLVASGLRWLVDGAPRDEGGLWLSPDLASIQHGSLKLVHGFRVYRSASRGVAGVLYTLAKLHRYGYMIPGVEEQVARAVDWLLDHQPTPDDQMVGLHFGEAGVAVAIAEAVASGLIERGPWLLPYTREALSGPLDWPDLSHGAAGQGMAALICSDLLGDPDLRNLAGRCADFLIASQEEDGSWVLPQGVKAMAGKTYSGFAHGVAGIVAFLAFHAKRFESPVTREAAIRGGQWLLGQARPSRNASLWWPMSTDTDDAWSWWCHGGPGIALGLLALFELTHEPIWRGAVRACLRVHPVEVRYPNLSQCHGMSGLGEILLEGYQVLGEAEWLSRAKAIGATLASLASETSQGSSWLVENPYRPTPDLMIGCGGVLHFLARLSTNGDHSFAPPLMPTGGSK